MIKEYEITVDGLSNGNAVAQPFNIKVHAMQYDSNAGFSKLTVGTCTCKDDNNYFVNDEVANILTYELPAVSTSKNDDLVATLEVLLEAKYPGKWAAVAE